MAEPRTVRENANTLSSVQIAENYFISEGCPSNLSFKHDIEAVFSEESEFFCSYQRCGITELHVSKL